MQKIVFFLALVFGSFACYAGEFVLSRNLFEAQKSIASMRFQDAQKRIERERLENPSNLASDYYQSFLECYQVLINQRNSDFEAFKKASEKRIQRLEAESSKSEMHDISLCQFELHLGFAKLVFGEYVGAAFNLRSANKLSRTLYAKKPGVLQNQKNYSLLLAALGTIPPKYAWVVTSIGMEGNFEGGIHKLKEFIAKTAHKPELELERAEALFTSTWLLLNFDNNKKETWTFIEKNSQQFQSNLWQAYLRALVAEKCYQARQCVQVIDQKPQENSEEQVPVFWYLRGSASLCLLKKEANRDLNQYLKHFKGKLYKKECLKKLCWYALLFESEQEYKRQRSLFLKTYGEQGEEKLVGKELEKGILPSKPLLMARLLFDGGQFNQALSTLQKTKPEQLSAYQQLEYYYRLGRIYQEQNQLEEALSAYKTCVELAPGFNSYYAPNACLQLGTLYAATKKTDQAKMWLKKALEFSGYEHESSINQSASNQLKLLNEVE
ncbi:hypothetical protein MASR2M44_03340 [Bacteroidota bacterium]